MLIRLTCLALLALHVSAAQFTVFHRFGEKNGKFVERGVVTVDDGKVSYAPSASIESVNENEAAWYQVAIRVGGEYITTSAPSCYADADATLTLHFMGDRPSGLEYKPSATAVCSAPVSSLPSSPIDVRIQRPQVVRSPSLAAPQVVDKTGQTVQPEPEKSFLQKYWMAIGGALLVISVMMGEEPKKDGQRGGGAGGAPQRAK